MNFAMLIIVFIGVICGVYAKPQQRCASIGDYCQNHWECCSNSCLSFSYKCVASNQQRPISSIPSSGVVNVQSIQDITNRFGEQTGTQSSLSTQSTRQCAAIGDYCQNHWECCSNSCLSFSYKCVRSNQPPQVVTGAIDELANRFGNENPQFAPGQSPIAGSNIPETINSIDELINRFSNMPNPNCLPIGGRCYRHDECCSQRCHSYLLQCVT